MKIISWCFNTVFWLKGELPMKQWNDIPFNQNHQNLLQAFPKKVLPAYHVTTSWESPHQIQKNRGVVEKVQTWHFFVFPKLKAIFKGVAIIYKGFKKHLWGIYSHLVLGRIIAVNKKKDYHRCRCGTLLSARENPGCLDIWFVVSHEIKIPEPYTPEN